MPRSVALLVCLLAAPAAAQNTGPALADSVVMEPFVYGRSRTYSAILSETVELQLIAPAFVDTLASGDPSLGITGLVVDETLTPSGRLFYETFFLVWTPPPGAESVTIEIGERPLPGNGTAIVATAAGEVVLQARLPRRADEVEDLARQAVAFVQNRLRT